MAHVKHNRLHILYIEDDAGLARLLQKRLERSNAYKIIIAKDAEQGLVVVKKQPVDAILLDYCLPGMSGIEFIETLHGKGTVIPIIMLTGAGNEQVAVDAMRLGVFDYLLKDTDGNYIRLLPNIILRMMEHQRLVTEKDALESRMRLIQASFKATSEGIVITDKDNHIIEVNPAFTRITGYSFDEVNKKDQKLLGSGQHDASFYSAMWNSLHKNSYWNGEIWNRRKSGEIYPGWMSISVIKNSADKIEYYVTVFNDISERKRSEEKIWHQANYDNLTGLPNRSLLFDRATELIQRGEREKISLAIVFLDLDRFKWINDTYGHSVGDELLRQVSKRITGCLRKSDTATRFAGDEFVIVLYPVFDNKNVAIVSGKLLAAISEPFGIMGRVINISASIGISTCPDNGTDIDDLIKKSDSAMYKSKTIGRNNFHFFDDEMQHYAQSQLQIQHDLTDSLRKSEFILHYQPVIDLQSSIIVGLEALIRWQHPERGLIYPDDFISAAESSGLITKIGSWVMDRACTQLNLWNNKFQSDFKMGINISIAQLRQVDYLANIPKQLARYHFKSGVVTLEIKESMVIEEMESLYADLHSLKESGLRLAVDDFGTGYSSMNYLRRLPVDDLKIDRSFIHDVTLTPENASLVKAIITMAHSLDLKVIAEGIESEDELKFLKEHGCEYGQGFLFSKPMPADDIEEQLRLQCDHS
ncbi:MAG: EAL domain-containing protein [Sedimenticola sp.]